MPITLPVQSSGQGGGYVADFDPLGATAFSALTDVTSKGEYYYVSQDSGTEVAPFGVELYKGQTITAKVDTPDHSILNNWNVGNAYEDPLGWGFITADGSYRGGNYLVDSSTAALNIGLVHEPEREYEFFDYLNNAATNNITIGTASDTFDSIAGAAQPGPFILDVDSAALRIVAKAAANTYAVVKESSFTEEGLRGAPVADNTTLTALNARDYERRKVLADGKEYVFELGAVSGTLADDAATGFWQEQVAEGLATTYVNSSAGATTETLSASTSSGVVRLFTNEDVTNSATLAVQAGETLNGVTDGTFIFSNYAAGTQFRADEVNGGWVVSVVGASDTQNELTFDPTVDLTVTGGGTVTYDDVIANPGANGTKIDNTGRCSISRLDGDRALITIAIAHDSDTITTFTLSNNICPGKILSMSSYMPTQNENSNYSFDVTGDKTFYLDRPTAVGNTYSVTFSIVVDGHASNNNTILAGMVTPTDLSITGVFDNEVAATFDGYEFRFSAATDEFEMRVTTGTTAITGVTSFQQGANQNSSPRTVTLDQTWRPVWIDSTLNMTVAGNNQRLYWSDGTNSYEFQGILGALNNDNFISIKRTNQKQVVMPDALPVEDVEDFILAGSTSLVTGVETLTLPNGQTWADIAATYRSIRVSAVSEFANDVYAEAEFILQDIFDSGKTEASIYATQNGGTNYEISIGGITPAGTTAIIDNVSNEHSKFRMYGIKPQKTVINTTDTPVNDQTASGYYDIGNMRIQWGTSNVNSSTNVTFPQPFANNTYSLVASMALNSSNGLIYAVNLGARTTTGFAATAMQQSGGTTSNIGSNIQWQAIGLKP